MTIYDKGLIRAMKKAYRDGGYDDRRYATRHKFDAVVLAQEVGKWFEKGKDKEIFYIFALDLLPSASDK